MKRMRKEDSQANEVRKKAKRESDERGSRPGIWIRTETSNHLFDEKKRGKVRRKDKKRRCLHLPREGLAEKRHVKEEWKVTPTVRLSISESSLALHLRPPHHQRKREGKGE